MLNEQLNVRVRHSVRGTVVWGLHREICAALHVVEPARCDLRLQAFTATHRNTPNLFGLRTG